MLRKVLVVVIAVISSYGLTALAGYVLYTNAAGRSEVQLSTIVRFIINPVITVLIGCLVGFVSKNHPIATSVVGLAPWGIMLLSPNKPTSISGWVGYLVPILVHLALGATAAQLSWRYRRKPSSQPGLLA